MSRRILVGALAALTFCAVAACTTATTSSSPADPAPSTYKYETLEHQLRDAQFHVVPGSIEAHGHSVTGSLSDVCDGQADHAFTMDYPPPSPLRLSMSYVAHPAPNIIKLDETSFTTQPTAADKATYDLCPRKPLTFATQAGLVAAYRAAGFAIVPARRAHHNAHGTTYVDLDLHCTDGMPRTVRRGELANLSVVIKDHEFISQPTDPQVADLGLCELVG